MSLLRLRFTESAICIYATDPGGFSYFSAKRISTSQLTGAAADLRKVVDDLLSKIEFANA